MKLETDSSQNNVQPTQGDFKISASGHAFKILSEGLYSNKIRAVIREISCNAADAHLAVGNKNPFTVVLPTRADPWFSVQDNGPGLSHDDILNLYTTYFLSNKSKDENVTGGFGLGSKAPFAYTSTFKVKSCFNGEERSYTASISPEGYPTIQLTDTQPCGSQTGITVRLAVGSDADISTFKREAETVFRAFDPAPSGVTLPPAPEKILEGADWALHRQRNDAHDRIQMGNVEYSFPQELCNIPRFKPLLYLYSSNTTFVLKVPVGFVTPTPSRESISMTDAGKLALTTKLDEILKDVNVKLNAELDKQTCLWDARWRCAEILNALGRNWDFLIPLYKGKEIPALDLRDFPIPKLRAYIFDRDEEGDIRRRTQNPGCKVHFEAEDSVIFGQIGSSKLYSETVKTWARAQQGRVVALYPETAAVKQEVLDIIGLPLARVHHISDLTKVSKPRNKGANIVSTYVLSLEERHDLPSLQKVDLNEGGIYVVGTRKNVSLKQSTNTGIYQIPKVFDVISVLSTVKPDIPDIGDTCTIFSPQMMAEKNIAGLSQWCELGEVLHSVVHDEELIKLGEEQHKTTNGDDVYEVKTWINVLEFALQHVQSYNIERIIEAAKKFTPSVHRVNILKELNNGRDYLGVVGHHPTRKPVTCPEIEIAKKQYSLLYLFKNSRYDHLSATMRRGLADYVKQIDLRCQSCENNRTIYELANEVTL